LEFILLGPEKRNDACFSTTPFSYVLSIEEMSRQSFSLFTIKGHIGTIDGSKFTQYEPSLKELHHGLRIWKSLAKMLEVRRLESELIFSILNHLCLFVVYYYLFGVFLS